MTESVEIGFQVFVGNSAVGAVRAVNRQKRELTVYIENAGDFTVHAKAILSVHDEKVTLALPQLEPGLRKALGHIEDAEDR